MHDALDDLPDGRNEPVKVLPTAEEIRQTFEHLTANAPEAPPSSYPGAQRILDDGTRIGLRENSDWGGPTIDVKYPDGTKRDVHLPIISFPPNLPPVLDHPPVAVPPVQTNHPPVALPPMVLEHPPLPPWLQNSSPPGFQVTPGDAPVYAPFDIPDAPAAPAPEATVPDTPITLPSLPSLPAPPPEAAAGAGGLAAVGAAILAGLGWLAHPFGR